MPADVSVVGIDDFDFANIMSPPPTVVAAPVVEMAQRAIEALFDEIKRKEAPSGSRELFEPRLIVRELARAV